MMPMVESMIVDADLGAAALRAPRRDARAAGAAGRSSGADGRGGASRAASRSRAPAEIDEAAAERDALAQAIGAVPDSALFGGTGLESARTHSRCSRRSCSTRASRGREAHATDRSSCGRRRSPRRIRVPYDEPPVWFYPIRESLGAALLARRTRRGGGAGVPGGSRIAIRATRARCSGCTRRSSSRAGRRRRVGEARATRRGRTPTCRWRSSEF